MTHGSRLASPTMSSTLPPPRSMHRAGGGSITTLALIAPKISRASSCPLMTSTLMPVAASISSTTSLPFAALRIALVAFAITSVAPEASASALRWRAESTTRRAVVSVMRPSRATSSPRRSMSFSRVIDAKVPSG